MTKPRVYWCVPATTSPQIHTPVFSTYPSADEWGFQNNRAKGIIDSHIEDLPSLIPDSDSKDAKEIFKALEAIFGGKDEM